MNFKCMYCDSETHAEVDCAKKKNDRLVEVGLGWFFTVILLPFALLGSIAGAAWGAMKAGFKTFEGMWPEARTALRGKEREEDGGARPD